MDGKWVVYIFEEKIKSKYSGGMGLCILPPQNEIQYFFLEYYNSRRFFNKRFTNNFMYSLLTLDSMKIEKYGNFRKFRSYKTNGIKMAPIINNMGKDIRAIGEYLEDALEMKIIRTSEIPV